MIELTLKSCSETLFLTSNLRYFSVANASDIGAEDTSSVVV